MNSLNVIPSAFTASFLKWVLYWRVGPIQAKVYCGENKKWFFNKQYGENPPISIALLAVPLNGAKTVS